MELISKLKDIKENLETLRRYKTSTNHREVNFYKKLILRGICFIVFKKDGNTLWGPSRFVGYKKNTMTSHRANKDKDGRITNPRISSIIGYAPKLNNTLENRYRRYCHSLGLRPWKRGQFGVKRKYWALKMK